MKKERTNRRGVRVVIALVLTSLALITGGCAANGTRNDTSSGIVTIHLTRHGQTWFNLLDRVQGWADSPLTEQGELSAVTLGEGFVARGMDFDAAYSGDMVRHHQTATLILEAMGEELAVERLAALREMSFGGFEGGTNGEMIAGILQSLGYASLEEFSPDGTIDKLELSAAIPGANPTLEMPAESPDEVAGRALAALVRIAEQESRLGNRDVLVVSSGLTILCVLDALGSPADEDIANGSVTTLVYDDGTWTVTGVNDTSLVDS